MADLKEIIAYILQKYPSDRGSDLSNARVTKMVYLADWRSCIKHEKPISNINWYFDNFGPYVSDVKDVVAKNPNIFKVYNGANWFGQPKVTFALAGDYNEFSIDDNDKETIEHVIKETSNLNWDAFIKLVYSTFPITSSDRYSFLNLIEKAKIYNPTQS